MQIRYDPRLPRKDDIADIFHGGFLKLIPYFLLLIFPHTGFGQATAPLVPMAGSELTHGPILGGLTAHSIRVWVRTAEAGPFAIRYGTDPQLRESVQEQAGRTLDADDRTGWVALDDLEAHTTYYYAVVLSSQVIDTRTGEALNSFMTLPDARTFADPDFNPAGLFNFSFEFGCGNNQRLSPDPPAYRTMLDRLKGRIAFQFMNGDFIYEEGRDGTVTGIWENYKIYFSRSAHLSRFYREIPAFFMFDDHEILNDLEGAGEPGLGDGRWLHRDIGVRAWYDYLGWANPDIGVRQQLVFSVGQMTAGSDILGDAAMDFRRIDLQKSGTLLVSTGQQNAGVYEIMEAPGPRQLRVSPAFPATEEASYSIGSNHYYTYRVGNTEFFVLDTRSYRTTHDHRQPLDPAASILGRRQLDWMRTAMRESDADILFVVSTMNWMIPHIHPTNPASNKSESYTGYAYERNQLLDFFETLGKPVLILTGDLHNSFAVKISDRVWEFASAPHASTNHRANDSGGYPASGAYRSVDRDCLIKWSTRFSNDLPRASQPFYAVVQVNNVYSNPLADGSLRWIAYEDKQVVVQFYDGLTGDLLYAEGITTAER